LARYPVSSIHPASSAVSVLKIGDGLPEALGYANRVAGILKKIHSFAQKIIIVVTGCPEVFDRPYVEIGETVAEENMSLHVCFNCSDLDGSKESETVFQICPPFKNSPTFKAPVLHYNYSNNWIAERKICLRFSFPTILNKPTGRF
jgi:hypothetical protein